MYIRCPRCGQIKHNFIIVASCDVLVDFEEEEEDTNMRQELYWHSRSQCICTQCRYMDDLSVFRREGGKHQEDFYDNL